MNVNGNRTPPEIVAARLAARPAPGASYNQASVKVLIVGCGRIGARLAAEMDGGGHEVTIIDTNAAAFARLGDSFGGEAIIGDGIDVDTLRRAGIEGVDAFCALTQGDNRNIMAAQIAQHVFRVPRVVCRIADPIRDEVYRKLGLKTYCPTITGASHVFDALQDAAP
jgi:trk/ktr system potassium uptake protein